MYLLNVSYMYSLCYMFKKTTALCPKKTQQPKNNKKIIFFFLPFAAKWPRVNAASVLDDYLLG